MSFTRRIIVVPAARIAQVNGFLAAQDIQPGIADAIHVGLWLTAQDPGVDPPVAYWTSWLLRDTWWTKMQAKVPGGWKINTGTNDVDLVHYKASNWTPAQVLADQTRKSKVLKVDDREPLP